MWHLHQSLLFCRNPFKYKLPVAGQTEDVIPANGLLVTALRPQVSVECLKTQKGQWPRMSSVFSAHIPGAAVVDRVLRTSVEIIKHTEKLFILPTGDRSIGTLRLHACSLGLLCKLYLVGTITAVRLGTSRALHARCHPQFHFDGSFARAMKHSGRNASL